MLPRGYKYYWLCQVLGWTFVTLSMLFFAYTFSPLKIDSRFFVRLFLIFSAGIFSTHILRAYIRKSEWLLLPVEKVIPRMIIAIIVTSLACSLFYMGLVSFLNVQSEVPRK